jgi:putative PEP-CTERM system TPR-repeat lipoprotein
MLTMRSRGFRWAFGLLLVVIAAGCRRQDPEAQFRKGNEYLSRGLPKEASLEYRSALTIDPKRGDIRLKLADTEMLLSDTTAALKDYIRAADLLPNDARAQVKAGALLLLAGAFEDAKARADKAIAIDSHDSTALVLRGNALAGLKDVNGAIEEYQEALALDPRQSAAYSNIATIRVVQRQGPEAEAAFRKAIDAAPKSVNARLSLANFLWVNNRAPEAEATLKEAVALDPSDLSANRMLGAFYMMSKRGAEAEPYFQAFVKAAGTTAASFSMSDYYFASRRFEDARKILTELAARDVSHDAATIRLAAIDAAQGQRSVAMSKLREMLVKHPKQMPTRLLVARLLLEDGKRDEALAQATSMVTEEPTSSVAGDAYLLIGQIQTARDNRGDAIRAYEEVLKRQPQPFTAMLNLAALNLASGSNDKAMTYIQQALAIQPKSGEARAVLVGILLAQNDVPKARETVSTLQKDFPNAAGTLTALAKVQLAEKQVDAAKASFTKAAAAAPDSVAALAGLVKIDFDNHRPTDAVRRVEAAVKSHPTEGVFLLAARTYAAVGNPAKTEEMLRLAIEADPSRPQAYSMLGALYVGEKQLDKAEARFHDAVNRSPKSVAANTVLAMLFEMQGKIPEAEKQYKNVLNINPNAAIALNNLAWLYVSHDRNLEEAFQLARTARQNAPKDPRVGDTLGWIYYRKGMIGDAVRELESSVRDDPKDPGGQYHLGMAYAEAGDLDKAKQALRRALTISPQFDGAAEARAKLSKLGG